MPEKQLWDITEALALADTWQNRFDGKICRGFFHSFTPWPSICMTMTGAACGRFAAERKHHGSIPFFGAQAEHARLLSRALFDAGEPDEALKLVEYYGSRPYLFDDLNKLGYFLFCRSAHCLATHDALKLAHCVTLL
jgi:hypothetical protein